MRVPPNGPGGSVSFAGLRAIGVLMIPAPRCHHPVCCLTGLGGLTPTCIATRRSGNCSRRRGSCRLITACGGRPITACWGCWAVAGLPISEARNLQTEDPDLKNGVLTIRGTKFGKCRLVPIHLSTRKVLSDYASRRDRFLGRQPATFFVSGRGTRLDGAEIRRTFYSLSRQIGLRGPTDSHGPRLHDFRHRADSPVMPIVRDGFRSLPVWRLTASAVRWLKSA